MQDINKKALSPIISMAFVVVVSLVSMTLVYGIYQNITESAQLGPALDCSTFQLLNPPTIESACINEQNNELEITTLMPLSTNQLTSFEFNFISPNSLSTKFACGNHPEIQEQCLVQCEMPNPGETKTYYVSLTEFTTTPTEVSLSTENCFLETEEITNC